MGITAFARGGLLLVPGIAAVLWSNPVLAEAEKLALPEIIEYSQQHNGGLRSFREEKGIRDANRVRAGLLPNPTLELEGSTGALTGSSAENSLSLGVSQEFFLAGKRGKRLAIAKQEEMVYHWQLADRKRLLREEVESVFYEVVLAEERLRLTDRSIELNRQLLGVTTERLAAGDIPELEMNLAKVELARSEGTRIEVERALLHTKERLFTLMGLPSGETAAIAGSLDNSFSLGKHLAELKQLALAKRPDLKTLVAEKARDDAEVVLSEAEGIPNLTAGLFYTHARSADATGIKEEKVSDNLIGIRLSLPIPVFDKNQAGVQEARARRSSTESRLTAAVRNVEREVATACTSVLNAEKVLALYKANIIPQLEENLKLTQEAYRLGEVGILSVIQEQKKFFEVSDGYLTALHARQLALVKLEAAVGVDLE